MCLLFSGQDKLPAEQQQSLYNRISEKIRAGKFVDYNPLEAIHDNLQRTNRPLPELINYFGKQLRRGVNYYVAWYNGEKGLYTEEVVKAYHMLNPEKFEI